jgi:hypothetical protein
VESASLRHGAGQAQVPARESTLRRLKVPLVLVCFYHLTCRIVKDRAALI